MLTIHKKFLNILSSLVAIGQWWRTFLGPSAQTATQNQLIFFKVLSGAMKKVYICQCRDRHGPRLWWTFSKVQTLVKDTKVHFKLKLSSRVPIEPPLEQARVPIDPPLEHGPHRSPLEQGPHRSPCKAGKGPHGCLFRAGSPLIPL